MQNASTLSYLGIRLHYHLCPSNALQWFDRSNNCTSKRALSLMCVCPFSDDAHKCEQLTQEIILHTLCVHHWVHWIFNGLVRWWWRQWSHVLVSSSMLHLVWWWRWGSSTASYSKQYISNQAMRVTVGRRGGGGSTPTLRWTGMLTSSTTMNVCLSHNAWCLLRHAEETTTTTTKWLLDWALKDLVWILWSRFQCRLWWLLVWDAGCREVPLLMKFIFHLYQLAFSILLLGYLPLCRQFKTRIESGVTTEQQCW